MTTNGNTQQSSGVQSKRLYAGKQFTPIVEGQTSPSFISAEYGNQYAALATAVCALKFADASMGSVAISDSNIVLTINTSGSNTGSPTPAASTGTNQLTLFKPTALTGGDYYLAQRVTNGNILAPTTDGVTVAIAKPLDFRTSIAGRLIDGVHLSYTYGSPPVDNARTSNDGTNSQVEVPLPRFATGDLEFTWAMPATHTMVANGTEVGWIEVLPSRMWLRQPPPGA